jgi:hypothetical protein
MQNDHENDFVKTYIRIERFSQPNPNKPEKPDNATVHRRDAEDAKVRWIFLSVDPLESEADMKGRKEKI